MGMGNLIDFHLERADGKFASWHLTVETCKSQAGSAEAATDCGSLLMLDYTTCVFFRFNQRIRIFVLDPPPPSFCSTLLSL